MDRKEDELQLQRKLQHLRISNCDSEIKTQITTAQAIATTKTVLTNSISEFLSNGIPVTTLVVNSHSCNSTNRSSSQSSSNNEDNNDSVNCNISDQLTDKKDRNNDSAIIGENDEAVKCIFLCEFHAIAGPKIVAQVPDNYITKDLFDTVNRYIIPKLQLERSFLSVSLLGKKILGYPIRIDNKLYARNGFYFNFCFVFAPTTRTIVYEPVVRKLSEYMVSMELSSKMLSQAGDAAQVTRLCRILAQIRRDLNKHKMCMLQEGSTIIPLCVVPLYRETPIVHPYSAAVLLSEFYKYVHSQWDLTTLRILPYVNGFNHIHRIAAMADVALGVVLDCITHLVLLGVAIVVPVFQYCNVYRPTPKLSQLAKCKILQKRCIEICSKSNRKSAKLRDIFRMFASMAHGATFGELCVRFNPAVLNINEKQMVLFGLLEGLIRRVDKYPVTVSRNLFYDDEDILRKPTSNVLISTTHIDPTFSSCNNPMPAKTRQSRPLPRGGRIKKNDDHSDHFSGQNSTNPSSTIYYNGLTSFDELCCSQGISSQQLESQLARDRHVIVLLK